MSSVDGRQSLAEVLAASADVDAGLAAVLETIAGTGSEIAARVKRARLEDIVGAVGETNVQGEEQQKLDVLSNEMLKAGLARCPAVAGIASEEEDDVVVVHEGSDGPSYSVLFDPLDGSSNIDVAVGIGTIFAVMPVRDGDVAGSVLQPGDALVAAGYVLYGSQVALVLTTGSGVDVYVLDPASDTFLRVEEGLALPTERKIYSINEANAESFGEGYQRYLRDAHGSGYSARYIGSMVADVHRTLLKGGVFLYPATEKNPTGKLRLLYEANPMGWLVEQAGGRATTGTGRILEIVPDAVHQRVPVILGSSGEVERVLKHLD